MLAVPILVLFIGGAIAFLSMRGSGMGFGGGLLGGWSGTAPLLCGGNQSIEASDITAAFSSGSAISAGGNCHVKCTRCRLQAPVAISVGGNAQIMLLDSHVEGSQTGVLAGGNAEVKFLGNSTLAGGVSKGGNAQVLAPPEPAPVGHPAPVAEPPHPASPAPPLPPSRPLHGRPGK